jgi:hypothetical protein
VRLVRAASGIALSAIAATTAAVVLDVGGFFTSLLVCRRENQAHRPAACAPVDRHPGLLFTAAVLTSIVVSAVAALGGGAGWRRAGLLGIVLGWGAYAIAILTT